MQYWIWLEAFAISGSVTSFKFQVQNVRKLRVVVSSTFDVYYGYTYIILWTNINSMLIFRQSIIFQRDTNVL